VSATGAVELALTRDLLESVADEMAVVCMRTAVSPNIKERRDLSAAVFAGDGRMVAHAAHIPVHLGAMPLSVRAVLESVPLGPGDVALLNDPYRGGTHLPDLTAVRAVFASPRDRDPQLLVAVRAHHADVGGAEPGSMAPQGDIQAEGLRIPPLRWVRAGTADPGVEALLLANMRDPEQRRADLAAQAGALGLGERRLRELAPGPRALAALAARGRALTDYAARIAGKALASLPDGSGHARVGLEVDDLEGRPAAIEVTLEKRGRRLRVDFAGTSGAVGAGLNAPEAVTRSAVYYFVRCLCPADTPTNDGLLRPVRLAVPAGSLLAARPPQPVAGGNVETSQRVVDALWLAASSLWPDVVPAPGAGTMSNWTFGPEPDGPAFPTYYETLPGGAGAGPRGAGHDAIQQHMTNTRSTPVEVLEAHWPVRVERMAVRAGSGGRGRHRGGCGLVREVRFLAPARVALLMTRHEEPPPGVHGGGAGRRGRTTLVRGGSSRRLPPRARLRVEAGDLLRFETPGGGGWGAEGPRRS
jgi:N-methylhydantoinase B